MQAADCLPNRRRNSSLQSQYLRVVSVESMWKLQRKKTCLISLLPWKGLAGQLSKWRCTKLNRIRKLMSPQEDGQLYKQCAKVTLARNAGKVQESEKNWNDIGTSHWPIKLVLESTSLKLNLFMESITRCAWARYIVIRVWKCSSSKVVPLTRTNSPNDGNGGSCCIEANPGAMWCDAGGKSYPLELSAAPPSAPPSSNWDTLSIPLFLELRAHSL